jgi:hypothetical protein
MLPETLFDSCYDEQQLMLRLTLQQDSQHALIDLSAGHWLPSVPGARRTDIFTWPHTAVPPQGLTAETLSHGELLSDEEKRTFGGQQQIWYLDEKQNATTEHPAFPPLPAFTESAVFDDPVLQEVSEYITPALLRQAGYRESPWLFPRPTDKGMLWTACKGYTTFAPAEQFRVPVAYRDTLLTGVATITWDPHYCVITGHRDAAGLTNKATYDWRFLSPVQVTDVNDNISTVTLDALGRVTTSRFFGTENGIPAGYSTAPFTPPSGVDDALSLSGPLPVAWCMVYATDSWMTEKTPPHILTLRTDRYDNDPEQQIRQQVIFCDGFGRPLQISVRHPGGKAWSRTDDGKLHVHDDGELVQTSTAFRWAVTGKTVYDNKGQPVKKWQPYFLDSWKYVSDDSARRDLYADTYYYDPVGREWQVKTAAGWLRRTLYTPWFTVKEDENDTAPPEWTKNQTYSAGTEVVWKYRKYVCIQSHVSDLNNKPETATEFWQRFRW